jgi:hypothetical protein
MADSEIKCYLIDHHALIIIEHRAEFRQSCVVEDLMRPEPVCRAKERWKLDIPKALRQKLVDERSRRFSKRIE